MFGENHFGIADYISVVATLLFSVGIGVYYACMGNQTNEEMLVGGRSMKALPIAASMLVTYLSAITILGYPAEVYAYGIQVLMMTLLGFICIPLSTVLFVRVFYNLKLTSVYEYLELRFDSVVVRWLASFTFILQVCLINGVVLYAPSIALEAIVGLPIWISITGIAFIGTVYTAVGGIKAVVVTDCFQFVMIAVGLVSIMVRGFISAGGIVHSFEIAEEKGRLVLFDFTFDPFMRHNFWNFFFGFGFTITSLYGTHQPQVQRYCSLPSVRDAFKALLLTVPMNLFVMVIVITTGVSVFAKYSSCCPILLGHIKKADSIVPYFVINELAFIPGMMGIFVSCIFSAVLSSISSTFNSLAAVTWEDFFTKIPYFAQMGPNSQGSCIRLLSLGYGILSVCVAFGAQNLGSIFQLVMTCVGATSGPLGGIFICGLLIPVINKVGAIVGMLAGLVSMIFVGVNAYMMQQQDYNFNPMLPTDLDECPPGTDYSKALNDTTSMYTLSQVDWPDKIFTLSYTMYPIVGAFITLSIALVVSLFTGGFCRFRQVPKKYVHPWLHGIRFDDDEDAAFRAKIQEMHFLQGKAAVISSPVQYPYDYHRITPSPSPNK